MADGDAILVFKLALFSRFVTFITQVILNAIVEDYDSSGMIWNNTTMDDVILKTFLGFAKWDSVYFLQIAEQGYLYEQHMAFFPLYPVVVRVMASVFSWILPAHFTYRSILLASSWITSFLSFTFAAVLLYRLTVTLFKNRQMAIISSILFCISPATVFMSAAYTESLFVCLQFTALYFLESGRVVSYLLAATFFCLGSATRANGIVSTGFITHALVKQLLSQIYYKKNQLDISYRVRSFLCYLLLVTARTFMQLLLYNGIIILPFMLFQYYGYLVYCTHSPNLNTNQSLWCNKILPVPYSYIQNHYWNVGFLRYFELKQVPNFFLAAPGITLSLYAVLSYCMNEQNKLTVKTLGLLSDSTWQEEKNCPSQLPACNDVFNQPKVFVYLVHLLFLTVFGLTSMHVQVVTRLIFSSSPAVYWFTAHIFLMEMKTRSTRSLNASAIIIGFFILYFFIGIALHCNFYPWT